MNVVDRQHANMDRPLPRSSYLLVVQAALQVGQVRFAREAVLEWLGQTPGDLQASLLYAQALLAEKPGAAPQAEQRAAARSAALIVLRGLCLTDPEYLEAAETWLWAEAGLQKASEALPENAAQQSALLRANVYALTGKTNGNETLSGWGAPVWMARQALFAGQLEQSKGWLRQALSEELPTPLAHVTHLRLLQADPTAPLPVRHKTAERYTRLWPDSLACMLFLADWSMEGGDAGAAVALLHQAAARDVGGQVAQRLWGAQHPYQRLWPEQIELTLSQAIPADVAAALGWNRLAEGRLRAIPKVRRDLPDDLSLDSTPSAGFDDSLNDWVDLELPEPAAAPRTGHPGTGQLGDGHPGHGHPGHGQPEPEQRRKPAAQPKHLPEELRTIQLELDQLARLAKTPRPSTQDGRYPVYVLFSVRSRLQAVYGDSTLELIESEMQRLAETLQRRGGWGARLFWADDPHNREKLGFQAARAGDAWDLKLALVDLDEALAKRGEMIGALLIVGGPEIVPFHCLPNPVDDQDKELASDNPYATRDDNYFIPEWPVGRLPGGAGSDARLLLGMLRRIRESHEQQIHPPHWSLRWLRSILQALGLSRDGRASLGYTAAVWKRAAEVVFRPVGSRRVLHVSPPMGAPVTPAEGDANGKARLPQLEGRLAYFNLHGVVDAPEWFGHRDPLDGDDDGPDYPIALRPLDLSSWAHASPLVVFSEACYGLHLQGRSVDQAMSLKFLETGSLAVVGSTCMAYGSVDEPLAAADWLGQAFWRHLRAGYPAGEALRQAKLSLASEMSHRQGYLDGEDQKTLVSFCLYGDPMALPPGKNGGLYGAKSVRRAVLHNTPLNMVCDRQGKADAPLSPEAMQSVRLVVAKYLPGMQDGRLVISQERPDCQDQGHTCPTSQLKRQPAAALGAKKPAQDAPQPGRKLVTISKQAERSGGTLPQVARLTLDEDGQVVKMVVSR